jgi:hypothetical protein
MPQLAGPDARECAGKLRRWAWTGTLSTLVRPTVYKPIGLTVRWQELGIGHRDDNPDYGRAESHRHEDESHGGVVDQSDTHGGHPFLPVHASPALIQICIKVMLFSVRSVSFVSVSSPELPQLREGFGGNYANSKSR